MTKINNIREDNGKTIIQTADGQIFLIRPTKHELLECCQKSGCPLIGIELGVLDYEFMKRNWRNISNIYQKHRSLLLKYEAHCPNDYQEFDRMPYDVYRGIKPYSIYLCKELSITKESQRQMFFQKNRQRWFIELDKGDSQIPTVLNDII